MKFTEAKPRRISMAPLDLYRNIIHGISTAVEAIAKAAMEMSRMHFFVFLLFHVFISPLFVNKYYINLSVGVLHIVADYRSKLWHIHGWALCDMVK